MILIASGMVVFPRQEILPCINWRNEVHHQEVFILSFLTVCSVTSYFKFILLNISAKMDYIYNFQTKENLFFLVVFVKVSQKQVRKLKYWL